MFVCVYFYIMSFMNITLTFLIDHYSVVVISN